jgi:ABC-type uncharacterized transport system auxiliary subunit
MKKYMALLLVGLFFSGCAGGSQTSRMVKYYTLEYPSPQLENLSKTGQVVRMERFTAIRSFHGNEMVYRPKPYERGVYSFHRWNITPADMTTELILRDIRRTKIFESILSYQDVGNARFLLDGRIEEFMEIDEGERSWASLIVHVTFSDTFRSGKENRTVLKKTYSFREPLEDRNPSGLAGAISKAVERFSKELILDLYGVVRGAV